MFRKRCDPFRYPVVLGQEFFIPTTPPTGHISAKGTFFQDMTITPNLQVSTKRSSEVARLLREAGQALSQDQPGAAEDMLAKVLELAPDNVEAHRLRGIAALRAGDHSRAIDSLRNALALAPEDALLNMTLGGILVETGAIEAGLERLHRACQLAPKNAAAWCNYGVALVFNENTEQARDAFERALDIDSTLIKARNKLAGVMVHLGETDAAVKMLRGTLSLQPDCVEAWATLSNLKTEPLNSADIEQLQELLSRPGIFDDARIQLKFVLAKALEDQSDYAEAYRVVSEANALKRRQFHWSRAEERARVDAIAEVFVNRPSEPVDATLGNEVIFVVSLPRSGSTLTEQILASHSQVQGCDELLVLPDILNDESERHGKPFPHWVPATTSADWHRMGAAYLERTRRFRDHHPRFTDKTPDNWAFVGAALAMLPGARVVNARRDPLETCFSCYRQLFRNGVHFSYDLDDLVDYYAGYQRLSDLWQTAFPLHYLESRYESMQEDLEGQVRRLLAFCSLSFEPECLSFHQTRRTVLTLSSAQVREPLRQNTARSERYGAHLNPLRTRLQAAGLSIAHT